MYAPWPSDNFVPKPQLQNLYFTKLDPAHIHCDRFCGTSTGIVYATTKRSPIPFVLLRCRRNLSMLLFFEWSRRRI